MNAHVRCEPTSDRNAPNVELITSGPIESTQRADFNRPARIEGAIASGASVSAQADLLVTGLVESQDIKVAGGLIAEAGIAGRSEGSIRVGGDLYASFIESSTAEVGRCARIERHAMNCNMMIHGRLIAPGASIVGGRIVVGRHAHVGILGGDSTQTAIVLGAVPLLETSLGELESALKNVHAIIADAQRELDMLSYPGMRLQPEEKEKRTELTFRLDRLKRSDARGNAARDVTRDRVRAFRTVDLLVTTRISASANIIVQNLSITPMRDVKGPFRLYRDDRGDLRCAHAGDDRGMPIKQYGGFRIRPV